MSDAVEERQIKEKELLIEQLRKTPIVQIACEKVGIGRATYYRWRKESEDFSNEADRSLQEGRMLVNDMAESQLMVAIKEKNMTAIIFWLKTHHPSYTPHIDVDSNKQSLSEQEIEVLIELLYDKNSFKQGQKLLMAYVFTKKIDEKSAQLVLRMFLAQMRADDVLTRKAEVEIMTEVLARKERK